MNTTVTIPCKTIKGLAWQMGRALYWKSVLIFLACTVLCNAPVIIIGSFTGDEFVLSLAEMTGFVLQAAVTVGMSRYFLLVFRGGDASIDKITETFSLTGKSIIIFMLVFFGIFIRSLLLVVPGIIFAVSVSQAYFVQVDRPDMNPFDCINESRVIMQGNKWKYVKLILSCIGWEILANAPSAAYFYMYGPNIFEYLPSYISSFENYMVYYSNYLDAAAAFNSSPVMICLRLFTVLASVYVMMSCACFFDLASGNLLIRDDSVIVQ